MIAAACNMFYTTKDLLPHYFKHYSNLEVDKFYFGIYGPENSPLWDEVRDYGKGLNITISKMYDDVFNPDCDTIFKIKIGQSINGWIVPTDPDELHTIEGYTSFQKLREDCEAEGADNVWGKIIDRITADGSIPLNIDPNQSIWEQFPRRCNLTETLVHACDVKISMFKSGLTLCTGHHVMTSPNPKGFSKASETHHFKWWGKLKEKEKTKLEALTQWNFPYTHENKRILEYLDSHNALGQ